MQKNALDLMQLLCFDSSNKYVNDKRAVGCEQVRRGVWEEIEKYENINPWANIYDCWNMSER